MGFGGYFKGEKKKPKKGNDKKGPVQVSSPFVLPQVEIMGKKKKNDW